MSERRRSIAFAERERIVDPSEAQREELMQAAWTVLAAAKDFGDLPAQLTARNVIDTMLRGRRKPTLADVQLVRSYFN